MLLPLQRLLLGFSKQVLEHKLDWHNDLVFLRTPVSRCSYWVSSLWLYANAQEYLIIILLQSNLSLAIILFVICPLKKDTWGKSNQKKILDPSLTFSSMFRCKLPNLQRQVSATLASWMGMHVILQQASLLLRSSSRPFEFWQQCPALMTT